MSLQELLQNKSRWGMAKMVRESHALYGSHAIDVHYNSRQALVQCKNRVMVLLFIVSISGEESLAVRYETHVESFLDGG
jgi:hypothetical protein